MVLITFAIFTESELLSQNHPAAIEWVQVESLDNPPLGNGLGTVGYSFRMSKFEITNLQYCLFLNHVAARDPHQLYDTRMQSEPCGGIERYLENDVCRYKVREGFEKLPVVFVSYLSAVRFVNWMHNGHQSTETETGSYDLCDKDTPRLEAARYWIPSESEWLKAGYYDPLKGTQGGYWTYPWRADDDPSQLASSTILAPFPLPRHGLPSSADLVWSGQGRCVLRPAEAWTGKPSYFGTLHQGGNVAEWVDGFLDLGHAGRLQITRGGGWDSTTKLLGADQFELHPRSFASSSTGFRIASKAPVVSHTKGNRIAMGVGNGGGT